MGKERALTRALGALAQQLAGFPVHEMHHCARGAIDGSIEAAGFFPGDVVQPMLNIHAGARTFEQNMTAHPSHLAIGGGPVN